MHKKQCPYTINSCIKNLSIFGIFVLFPWLLLYFGIFNWITFSFVLRPPPIVAIGAFGPWRIIVIMYYIITIIFYYGLLVSANRPPMIVCPSANSKNKILWCAVGKTLSCSTLPRIYKPLCNPNKAKSSSAFCVNFVLFTPQERGVALLWYGQPQLNKPGIDVI